MSIINLGPYLLFAKLISCFYRRNFNSLKYCLSVHWFSLKTNYSRYIKVKFLSKQRITKIQNFIFPNLIFKFQMAVIILKKLNFLKNLKHFFWKIQFSNFWNSLFSNSNKRDWVITCWESASLNSKLVFPITDSFCLQNFIFCSLLIKM